MFMKLLSRAWHMVTARVQVLQDRLRSWAEPPRTSLTLGSLHDLARSKPQLVIENALLRQQLLVLNRSAKRPRLTRADRVRVVLLASRLPHWKAARLWHRSCGGGWAFLPYSC
jgi:hypothetical protein